MNKMITLRFALCCLLGFTFSPVSAFTGASDSCWVNDICQTSIDIPALFPDEPFLCIDGCNLSATPELFNNSCQIGVFPTVWYSLFAAGASLINIQVSSSDIESPVITLFQVFSNCNNLIQVPLSSNTLPCIVGSNGVAEALGTDIVSNTVYMIAISSYDVFGGEFTLCLNTISEASKCVTDRDLTIEARSAGGDLAGPFIPGETVSVCMNVNSYTAAFNDCQWFQGLVPVFGNGWDPSSFNADGQPLNATINGNPMGVQSNGKYGVSTWDWFTDVDYHFDDPIRQLGDFDGNGTLDMCSIAYDPDCPDVGGLSGGCCNPCWGNPIGSLLPPGWFAYGMNGSCSQEGPPIRVDWGDGNSCGGPMGPWSFCFDLKVRPYPDCQQDVTTRDLSLGFFTFADGEVGAWTGAASICALDQPVKVTLPLACDQVTDLGIEVLEDKCVNSIFDYTIDAPGIESWSWSVFPFWAVKNSPKEGENGYSIHDTLVNPMSEPVEVTYFFTGYEEGSFDIVIKQVRFRVIPEIQSSLPGLLQLCEKDKDTLILSAEPLSGGLAPFQFLWNPGGETTPSIAVLPPIQNSTITLSINDSIGCMYYREIMLKVKPCQFDTIVTDDESNDHHTFEDGPVGGGKITNPFANPISNTKTADQLKVYPSPAADVVYIEWPESVNNALTIGILDTKGNVLNQHTLTDEERGHHVFNANVSHYRDGVYVVILQTSQSVLAGKLVKI